MKNYGRSVAGFWGRESQFSMGVAGRLTKLQWMASKPKVYGQHKLEMINLIFKKDDVMLGAVRR